MPINKTVEKILKKNNGHVPKAYSNQKSNQYLKEICKQVSLLKGDIEKTITKGGKAQSTTLKKWELVTTHTARRSFATNEVKKRTPVSIIMAITGHATEKSFWKYVKLAREDYANMLIAINEKKGAENF